MTRRVGRTVAGIKLVKAAAGEPWTTEDGRFQFEQDDNATTFKEKGGIVTDVEVAETTWAAWDCWALGGQGDHAFNGPTGYDTLTEAVQWVADHLPAQGV